MEDTDEVKFNVAETCYTLIHDKDIDWQAFDQRVKEIRAKVPNLPPDTQFGVVRVANIISIYYEIYQRIKRASGISGWGFNLGRKVLSEKRDTAQRFKIGVALIYPGDLWRISKSLNIEWNRPDWSWRLEWLLSHPELDVIPF